MSQLDAEEQRLDELIRSCSLQLKHMTEDKENSSQAYVTYHDIRKINSFSKDTVIAIKAPAETRLEVPDPKEVCYLLVFSPVLICYLLQNRPICDKFLFSWCLENTDHVEKSKWAN